MSSEKQPPSRVDPHWAFATKQIDVRQSPGSATNARALPSQQTTSYTFTDTAHAAALEGGVATLFLASGQATETFATLNWPESEITSCPAHGPTAKPVICSTISLAKIRI